MEHGFAIDNNFELNDQPDDQPNDQFKRYVGYEERHSDIFNNKVVRLVSKKITHLLMGVDPENRPIIVPDSTIFSVMSSITHGFRPQEDGNIYTRYTIPSSIQISHNRQIM
jgi:hypothetical protein